jgi:hypothetical protein
MMWVAGIVAVVITVMLYCACWVSGDEADEARRLGRE